MPRTLLVACLAASLLVTTLPARAEHGQGGVSFESLGGNEWWVEVQWFGDPWEWTATYVRDTGGAWKQMTHPSWAVYRSHYVASYHVEPGNLVQFKVVNADREVVSCWFAHPVAQERCDGSETGAVTWRVTGDRNNLRVEATGRDHTVARVSYGVLGEHIGWAGGWMLDGPEGGPWTYSGTVPHATVMFVSSSADDRYMSLSGCYRLPAASPVPCPDVLEGWVENVHSDGNGVMHAEAHWFQDTPLADIQVRFDGGPFRDMTFHDETWWHWEYAGAPTSGEHVAEFRMKAGDGRVLCDEDGYHWPQTTEHEAPMILETRFAEARGDASWVQTNVYGYDVVAVEASVNGGAWQPLAFQPWCDWGKAMSAPSGSTVRFRAFHSNFSVTESAPVAWPPAGSGFDASFANVKGNAWWVEAKVTGNEPIAKVEAAVNGGAWRALTLRSWGAWAASFSVPEGSIVQLRATSTSGATDLSGCYRWTAATPVECGGTDPGDFDATFRNVRGNEWWIETDVSVTGGTLAGVDARVNGGTWIPLEKKSYGSWAKSIHAPAGSTVEFRARATDGSTDVSSAYRWPPG